MYKWGLGDICERIEAGHPGLYAHLPTSSGELGHHFVTSIQVFEGLNRLSGFSTLHFVIRSISTNFIYLFQQALLRLRKVFSGHKYVNNPAHFIRSSH